MLAAEVEQLFTCFSESRNHGMVWVGRDLRFSSNIPAVARVAIHFSLQQLFLLMKKKKWKGASDETVVSCVFA